MKSNSAQGEGLIVCVVGYGSIGRRHAENAKSIGADVFFLRTGRAAKNRPEASDNIEAVWDVESALQKKPDIAIIANPTSLHIEYAFKFAENSTHLLIEKPISHNSDRIDRLNEVIKDNKLKCLVGYMMRFEPNVEYLKKAITGGRLGNILSAHFEWGTHMPDWHPWEDYKTGYAAKKELGGGVVLTCSHEIDLALYLFGDVDHVYASGGARTSLGIDVDDCMDAVIVHTSGVASTIHLDFIQKPGSRYARIIGEKATARWDFFENKVVITFRDNSTESNSLPAGFDFNEVYIKELVALFESIRLSTDSPVDFTEGMKAFRVSQAVLQSMSSKCIVSIK